MNFVSIDTTATNNDESKELDETFCNVKRAMKQLNAKQIILHKDKKDMIHFDLSFYLNTKPSILMNGQWSFYESNGSLTVKVRLRDENQIIKNVFKGGSQTANIEYCNYLSEMNSRDASKILGSYFIFQKQTLPIFRCTFTSFSKQSIVANYMYLFSKIKLQIADDIANFINKFQLLCFNKRSQNEALVHEKLIELRQCFEENRSRRKNASSVKLGFYKNKIATKFIMEGFIYFQKQQRIDRKFNMAVINNYVDKMNKKLKTKRSDEDLNLTQGIMCGIQILEDGYQTNKFYGGFGSITILQNLKFSVQLSTNPDISASKNEQNIHKNIYQKNKLIKKKGESKSQNQSYALNAFRNEVKVLTYLRNKRNSYIASYYIETCCNLKQVQSIYIDYYDKTLYQVYAQVSNDKKLQICQKILRGIMFLNENNILHRDLKEENIMLDKNMNPKIIDFGSSCNILKCQTSFTPIYYQLLSTTHYYFPYQDLQGFNGLKHKYPERADYEQHKKFDLYSFGEIVANIFELNKMCDSSKIKEQLGYLVGKCQQINPQDRLDFQEVDLYLSLIIKLNRVYEFPKEQYFEDKKCKDTMQKCQS